MMAVRFKNGTFYDGTAALNTYSGGRSVTYIYDAAGNRTLVNDDGTNTVYTANLLNQYSQVGNAAFTYDADGNMTRRTDALGTTFYEYNVENRLVTITSPGKLLRLTYDSKGCPVSTILNGITNTFLNEASGFSDAVSVYGNQGQLLNRFDYGIGLVSQTDELGNYNFFSFDAVGNTRDITDSSAQILNSYNYEPFGTILDSQETIANHFKLTGRFGVLDQGDLFLMGARHYDSKLGRFTSVDPLGVEAGDLNLYRYVANSPTVRIDPAGTMPSDSETEYWVNWYLWKHHGNVQLAHETLAQDRNEGRVPYNDATAAAAKYLFTAHKTHSAPSSFRARVAVALIWTVIEGGYQATKWLAEKTLGQRGLEILAVGDKPASPASLNQFWYGLYGAWKISVEIPFIAIDTNVVPVVRPIDPNDKLGPAGIGPNKVMSAQDDFHYTIRFENFGTATAPVQELVVVDYLDANLDWATVSLKEVAYGDRIITPSAGTQSFTIRDKPPVDSTSITGADVGKFVIDLSGHLNPQTGRLEWRMTCIDTNTGTFPYDALSGFLPPENGTGRGNGYVRFSVKPKSNLPIGTGITNLASIVFDSNDAINTPAVWNLIGDVPSLSTVIAYLPGQIMAGMPFSYTFTLTNSGLTTVTNVTLTNALPAGMNLVNASATMGTVTVTNDTLIWDIGTLTNGFGGTLSITLRPTQSGIFTNNLSFSGGSGLAIFQSPSVITVLPSAPTLGIRLVNGQVELFWSTNFSGFHVQKTSSLLNANPWVDLTNAPVIVGAEYRLTNGLPTGKQFYRLVAQTSLTANPLLGIRQVSGLLELSWPTNAPGFTLESATNLTTTNWTAIATAPVVIGGQNVVTNAISTGTKFYRLHKP